MSQSATRTGILVGVDGSAEPDAAIRWATHEAVMRCAPMILADMVAPVVASWPMGSLRAGGCRAGGPHRFFRPQKPRLRLCQPKVRTPRGRHSIETS